MNLSRLALKSSKTSLLVLLLVSLSVNFVVTENLGAPQETDSYSYSFLVDEDGTAFVTINYTSNTRSGSSWVIVPSFLELTSYTRFGRILNSTFSSTREKTNVDYYFYKALDFSFQSDGYFEMIVQFNFTSAAMIIEPDGIFLSPQIGFKPGGRGSAEVIFPSNFNVERAIGGLGYMPSYTNSNYVQFDSLPEYALRLEVEFAISDGEKDLLRIEDGIFTFETVRRYGGYARDILSLFNRTYDDFVEVFNTTLEDVNIEFFIPDFESLFSVAGYVPFTSKDIGNIYINIFYTRYVKGYIEVTALHELVHHFLWKAGLSPEDLLWFHEGMAQYVSIELVTNMGYEGASMRKQELEDGISELEVENGLGFLLQWTPSYKPADWGTLYTAAYYAVTRLAEPYGGLEYYAQLFKLLNGVQVKDSGMLAYYLSLAANATVISQLRDWGFDIVDLSGYSNLVMEAEKAINRINPISQPYKFFAEQLHQWALSKIRQGQMDIAKTSLFVVIVIAEFSSLLTTITVAIGLYAAIYALNRKRLSQDRHM